LEQIISSLWNCLPPVDTGVPEPPKPRQQPQQQTNSHDQQAVLPNRPVLIAQIDDAQRVPENISTTPNKYASIPDGKFTNDLGRAESSGSGFGPTSWTGTPDGSSSSGETVTGSEVVKANVPPPVAKAEPTKHIPQSKGVVNGLAIELPKPTYSPVARQMNLSGTVNVQVLIDESGDVVSAKAINGHILFKQEAERAAKKAKFRPTLLSDQPVKVTGMIVYNFKRS
jgi:protein TonB